MEPNALMQTTVTLFGLAAGSSLVTVLLRLGGIPRPPDWLDTGYLVLAAIGMALLCLAALTTGLSPMAQLATALFLLAAGSGFAAHWYLHRQRLPIKLMVVRSFLASVAFVLLLVSIFGQTYVNQMAVPVMIHTG